MNQEWVQKQLQLFNFDFDKADKNKNGSLSSFELMRILRANGFNGTYDEMQCIFQFLDADGDRAVSREEFNCAIKVMPKMTLREYALRKLFKSLDLDGSGYLTKDEIKNAAKHELGDVELSEDVVNHVLAALSKDDDQKLNYEEFLRDFKLQKEATELRLLFAKLDADKSGFLTRKEIMEAAESEFELKLSMDKITDLIASLTRDDDQKFSYEEFINIWLKGEGGRDKEWIEKQLKQFSFDFDEADKDKSGSLSLSEIYVILKAQGYNGTLDEAKGIFKHIDTDGDRNITKEEFTEAMKNFPKMTIKDFVLRKVFKSLDTDASGFLTRDEIVCASRNDRVGIEISQSAIDQILDALSKDSDQKLDYEEFLRAYKYETAASELRRIFTNLDTDGSGFLTRKEMYDAICSDYELSRITNLITDLSKDDDEKISYEEFVNIWMKK